MNDCEILELCFRTGTFRVPNFISFSKIKNNDEALLYLSYSTYVCVSIVHVWILMYENEVCVCVSAGR